MTAAPTEIQINQRAIECYARDLHVQFCFIFTLMTLGGLMFVYADSVGVFLTGSHFMFNNKEKIYAALYLRIMSMGSLVGWMFLVCCLSARALCRRRCGAQAYPLLLAETVLYGDAMLKWLAWPGLLAAVIGTLGILVKPGLHHGSTAARQDDALLFLFQSSEVLMFFLGSWMLLLIRRAGHCADYWPERGGAG